jgi:hypothetical protein
MNSLVDLQERLRMTGAALGKLEGQLQVSASSRGLQSNILSLRRLHGELQIEFAVAANASGLDVCHYRILNDRPTAKGLSESIRGFQESVLIAYDAILNGPKARRSIAPTVAVLAELQVAYAYPGSFGIAFTVPNDRMLLPDFPSSFDQATEAILDLAKAQGDRPAIIRAERRYGKSLMNAVYTWANDNATNHVGVGVEWRRGEDVRRETVIQVPEFAALSESMVRITDSHDELVDIPGTLVGADTESKKFHFVTESDADIRGKFNEAISESQAARLPGKYKAYLRKTIKTSFATERDQVSYFLERLEVLDSRK